MSVLWHKVWFDLWHNKARTLLVVLSIAAGVFAIGGIFGMVDQLLVGMDGAHRAVVPSHVNIFLIDYIDQDLVDELKEVPGVLDIDPANQLSVRYRTNPDDDWEIGTLVMRPDYEDQTFDLMALKDGAWPARTEVGIERLSGQYYGTAVGDAVEFEIDGEPTSFTVNGVIRHPFVQPPPFGGQAHFFADATGLAEFGIPEGLYGQLLVRVEDYNLDKAQDIAGDLRSTLAEKGVSVAVSLYQDPDRHWGRQFVEGITLILQLMAVVSLLMSVFLVLTTLTALITQQTDQIGMIKAIGGQRGTVIRVYLAGVFVYGLLALLIALPLGMAFAFGMSRWFLNIFNIDYDVFQFSWLAVGLQVAAAFVAPVIAALWPVLKGASITVRQAIASYGLGGDFGFNRFDRLVDRVGERFLPSAYAAALGNVFRRKERLLLTLVVLVVAGTMFLVIMSLAASIQLTLDNDVARRGYDVRIGFSSPHDSATILAVPEEVDGVEEAEVWFARNATILREGERLEDSAGLGAQLTGIPANSDMYRPIITAGRWLQPGDGQVIVVRQDTADKNGIAVGDTVVLDLGNLGSGEWQVIGLYRIVYDPGFTTEAIYAPLEALASVTGLEGVGNEVLVRTRFNLLTTMQIVSDQLKTRYEVRDLTVIPYTTGIKLEEREYAENQFSTVVSMLMGLAFLVASVGGIGLMGSLSIGVVERRREIGVMRAIGAESGTIMGLFMMEGVLQAVLSWMIAVPISYLVAQPLARQLGQTMIDVDLDFAYNPWAVGIWLAVVLVVAVVFSVGPARSATRISVRQSLAYA